MVAQYNNNNKERNIFLKHKKGSWPFSLFSTSSKQIPALKYYFTPTDINSYIEYLQNIIMTIQGKYLPISCMN